MSDQIQIRVHVIDEESRLSVKSVRVEIWDKNPNTDDRQVTETITDEQGFAKVEIAAVDLQENNSLPDIYFKLFHEDQLLMSTEENTLWNLDNQDQILQLAVAAPAELLNGSYLPHKLVAGHPDQFIEGRYFQPVIVYARKTSQPDEDMVDQDNINGLGRNNRDHDGDREDDDINRDAWDLLASGEEDLIAESIPSHRYRAIVELQHQVAKDKIHDKTSTVIEWNVKSPGINLLRQNLGILFYDRMRYRFTGSVIGEQLYTMSLAPGEEVTLTQTSETRRSVSMEKVETREDEQELTLSSNWSTEVTSDQVKSATTSVGGDLSVADAVISPKIDFLKVGANTTAQFDQTLETSSSDQRKHALKISRELTRRARQEHKTSFKIESEETTTFGSKRLLVNRNPTRSISFNFFKIYNKYRVILERYNAKLALSLTLSNPYNRMFSQIEKDIERMAYDNPENYDCSQIFRGMSTITFKFEDPTSESGQLPNAPQILTEFLEKTDGTIRYSHCAYEITRWKIKKVQSGDPDNLDNLEIRQEDKSPEEFEQFGGQVSYNAAEQFGDNGIPGVGVNLKVTPAIHPLALTFAPGVWWTTQVEIKVTVHFKIAEGYNEHYDNCIRSEEERLRNAFTPELVATLIQNVTGQTTEHLYMRLIETYFLSLFNHTGSPVNDFLIRDFRNYFDWNEAVIQGLPSWMQGKIAARFEKLLDRIQELLPGFDARSIFPAGFDTSGVEVFLPIRSGMEHNVFEFLNGSAEWNGKAYILNFKSFHKQHFGSVPTSLPTYKDIMAPGPDRATTLGAKAWEENWEKPRRKFKVLDEWADYMPTDGVIMESMLGQTDSSEALQAEALRSDLETAKAHQELLRAQAESARKLADREDVTVHYNLSDEG